MSTQPPNLLLSGHRPCIRSSQPRFTVLLLLGISKPSTSHPSHLRLLCSSGRVAPGQTQMGDDLGLYHRGDSRASTPSAQLQTTSEHHHLASAQLILHGGWKLMVSGHCKSLQLTGLSKSLPLICQQQPRLNYKRRVYSPHTKGAPWGPSLDDRGGSATGPTGHWLH